MLLDIHQVTNADPKPNVRSVGVSANVMPHSKDGSTRFDIANMLDLVSVSGQSHYCATRHVGMAGL